MQGINQKLLSIRRETILSVFLILAKCLEHLASSADIVCPLWTRRGDSGACECGDNLGGVVNCDPSTLEVTCGCF